MATFPYTPDWGPTPELQPNVLKATFGEGYEQRAENGLTPYLPSWSLTFSVRPQAEAMGIASWLQANKAATVPFDWAPPGFGTANGEQFGTGDGSRVAFQLTAGGQIVTRATNVVITRTDWQGSQLLYSTARTNYCPYSQALASWDASNSPTIASGAKALGPLSMDLIGDTSTTAGSSFYKAVAAPSGDNEVSFFLAAGTSTSTVVQLYDATASAVRMRAVVAWSAGVPTVNMTVGTLLSVDALASGVYRVRTLATGVVGANTNRVFIYPAYDGSTLTLTGNVYAGGFQVGAGGYIATTSSPVSVTDYTLSASGLVTLAVPPLQGAVLTWSGSYTFRFVADKWTPARPDGWNSWSTTANFRQVMG